MRHYHLDRYNQNLVNSLKLLATNCHIRRLYILINVHSSCNINKANNTTVGNAHPKHDTYRSNSHKSIYLSIYLSYSETFCVKLDTVAAKPLYIAAYYHPKENEAKRELNGSLEKVSMKKGLGRLQPSKFYWDSEHIPFIKLGYRYPSIHDCFISCLDNYDQVQMVSKPARCDNVLSLFLTSNYTSILRFNEKLPGSLIKFYSAVKTSNEVHFSYIIVWNTLQF